MKPLFAVLFALTVITPALADASQIVMVEPTKIVGSAWVEFMPNDGGAVNGNAWVNVWPSNKSVGMYAYTQVAEAYTQLYGGLAVRKGLVELGAGIGVENADGDIGLRKSVYGVFVRGAFSSANWYEHSKAGGSWLLSQNLYGLTPGRFEAGMRFQRYLGGGPMARMTFPSVGRITTQVHASALFDGDNVNPILGLNLNF